MKITVYIDNSALHRKHKLEEFVSFENFVGYLDLHVSNINSNSEYTVIRAELDPDLYDIKMICLAAWPYNRPQYSFVSKNARPYPSGYQPEERRIEPQL